MGFEERPVPGPGSSEEGGLTNEASGSGASLRGASEGTEAETRERSVDVSGPPPLPEEGVGPPPLPASAFPKLEGRLHGLTVLFAGWNAVRGLMIPLLIVWYFGRRSFLGGFLLIFLIIPMVVAFVRYLTFRYRIEGGELVTRQGVFSRKERNIPLSRIQDVRIDQGVLHRLLHMADVYVDTAGGQGMEASMSVLSRRQAEVLREAVIQHKANQVSMEVPQEVETRREEASPGLGEGSQAVEETIWTCRVKDLVMAGIASNHLASALAILAVVFGLLDDLMPQGQEDRAMKGYVEQAMQWLDQSQGSGWLIYGGIILAVLFVGMVFSVAGMVSLFYGFTLARQGEDLRRTYGLFTRRSSNLPRRRLQVLKIEEKMIRRLFRLATLRADRAGGGGQAQAQESKSGRDVLVPTIGREHVEGLLPVFFPGLHLNQGIWRQVSRRAIRRGTAVGALLCLLLTLALVLVERHWVALWPLLLIPLVYGLNVMSFKHLGYWLSPDYFRTRRGWLSRSGHVVPIRNIQSVTIRENPFDRRHRVGTLNVDTAGQAFTGGGPAMNNVPREDVESLAWVLARRAAKTRYRW